MDIGIRYRENHGLITRILPMGSPSAWLITRRTIWGIWVEVVTMILSFYM